MLKQKTLVLLLALIVLASQSFVVYAQEAETPIIEPTNVNSIVVSEEVKTEVESQLTVSGEAAKEVELDLKTELDLPQDFDPIVPHNFVNTVSYGLKNFGRNVSEAFVDGFGSETAHAEMVNRHANEKLFEATKLHSMEPDNKKVVEILQDYQEGLEKVKDKIEEVKKEDENSAKELSAEIAEDNLFIAPKVLNSLENDFLTSNPGAIAELIDIRRRVLHSAGNAVVLASDSETEVAETLKLMAEKNFKTPFSGIAIADILTQTKEQMADDSSGFQTAFEDAINASLDNVEGNLKTLAVSDEIKAENFSKFVEQLPGQSVNRFKVIEMLKNRSDLPPVMIEKMAEIKAKIAQNMTEKIEQVEDENIRAMMTKAMFEFKDPGIEEIKLTIEIKDLIPNEKIKLEIKQKNE